MPHSPTIHCPGCPADHRGPQPQDPAQIPTRALVEIVRQVQRALWYDARAGRWDPDLEWSPDMIETTADALARAGLEPDR